MEKLIKPAVLPMPPGIFNVLLCQIPPGIDRPLDDQFSGGWHSLSVFNPLLNHPLIPFPSNLDFEGFFHANIKWLTERSASPGNVLDFHAQILNSVHHRSHHVHPVGIEHEQWHNSCQSSCHVRGKNLFYPHNHACLVHPCRFLAGIEAH